MLAATTPMRGPIMAVAGALRAVPPIALLMLALPYIGLGFVPALTALTVLAVPPIAVNVDVGIRGVPAATLDAARGLGMSGLQVMGYVRLPLAWPVIVTGMRTAATETTANATLATFVGAGGLGDVITAGLQYEQQALVLAGGIAAAALTILTDALLANLSRAARAQN